MNFAEQEFRAVARFQRVSPQKARLVLDLIKGRRVEDAVNTLTFTKKGIAPSIGKLLRSAIENANYLGQEKGLDVDVDQLYVKRAIANEGPRMKRIRPAPMGRAFRYQRRMAHIEIAIAERLRAGANEAATVVSEPPAAAKKRAARPAANNKTARPGIIIGRKGAEIDKLKVELQQRTKRDVFVDIQEVHKPELDAQLVSESIALQLEKRVGFRRAMRKSVDSALRFGCKGIKVRVSGRLNGNEIARSEWYLQGRLPLHTLRADIEYGFTEARTTYGVIGVKAWIYRGEILTQKKREAQQPAGAF